MSFLNNHHFFDWCRLFDEQWRARIAMSWKGKRAEESVAKFHADNPGHPPIVNMAKWRIDRARRDAARRRLA